MTTKLTPSQQAAIERTKRMVSGWYGDVDYNIWQPRNTDMTILIAHYDAKNMLGTISRFQASWEIGKRGKVTRR